MSGERSQLRYYNLVKSVALKTMEVNGCPQRRGKKTSGKGDRKYKAAPPPTAVRLRRSWNPWWHRQSKGDGKGAERFAEQRVRPQMNFPEAASFSLFLESAAKLMWYVL